MLLNISNGFIFENILISFQCVTKAIMVTHAVQVVIIVQHKRHHAIRLLATADSKNEGKMFCNSTEFFTSSLFPSFFFFFF